MFRLFSSILLRLRGFLSWVVFFFVFLFSSNSCGIGDRICFLGVWIFVFNFVLIMGFGFLCDYSILFVA
uniref:Uncharacterized protein n=1 Tax=Rhizophora mucronata TaxID=61149 RepID=A0A2P2QUE2_RHIMU